MEKVLIVGSGAVGTLMSYALMSVGVEPYMLLKDSQRLAVIRSSGLRLRRVNDSVERLNGVHLITYEDLLRIGFFDLIIMATKAYDFLEALKTVRTYLGEEGVLVTCQNGLRSYEEALEVLGPERVAALVLNHGVYRSGLYEFTWIGGSTSYLGSRGAPRELLRDVSSLLKVLNVEVVDDIEPYRWVKLSVNAAINPLTALHGVRNKHVVTDKNLFRIATGVVTEAREVAEKLGLALYVDPLNELIRVAETTGENYSSMYQDLINRRRTEVDYINGEIVVRGMSVGVKTPINEILWLMVRAKESLMRVDL